MTAAGCTLDGTAAATMNPNLDRLLSSLADVQQTGEGQWQARCPAHDDDRPSLSVGVSGTKILVCCQAGCSFNDVVAAVGMEVRDMFPPRVGKRIVAAYDYRDAQGELAFQAVRVEPKDFCQRRPDGSGGWIWKVKGCPVIPYRLPELLAADPAQPVFVPEGEKDVNNLVALGLNATCNAGGAGKWRSAHAKYLAGRRVAILPDNDDAGRQHAAKVASTLHGKASSVRVVELPGLPPKGDVSDWLKAGGTVDELRAMVAEAPEYEPTTPALSTVDSPALSATLRPLTDMGNGERFAALHGRTVRYIHAWDKWLVWTGRRWAVDESGAVWRLAKETALAIYHEAAIEKADDEAICKWAKASQSKERLGAMLALARSELPIPIAVAELDADPWLLNCENGTVDLRTGELLQHDPALLLTRSTRIEYPTLPGEDAALWSEFLHTIFASDSELIGFVQRLMGVALVGQQLEHLLPVFHGNGANGKSVFTTTVMAALGEYAMQAPHGLLMARRGETHPTEQADLFGKRLVIVSETRDGQRFDEGLVKSVTGGDPIRARRMREDFWEFLPSHLLAVVTNHRPVVRGTDHGIWRRLRLVPFEVTIPDDQQDKALPAKLAQELPAILRWMVEGCLAWQRDGLGEPAKVMAATKDYRQESDVIGLWLNDRCVVADGYQCKAGDAFHDFVAWCEDARERPLSKVAFGKRIGERFERTDRTRDGYWYLGFDLVRESKTGGV